MAMNLCRACGHDFASVRTFDDHRVGKYEYLWSPVQEDGRRCLDSVEMVVGRSMSGAGGLTHPSTPESVYARGVSRRGSLWSYLTVTRARSAGSRRQHAVRREEEVWLPEARRLRDAVAARAERRDVERPEAKWL